jgi:gamma-glutamyl-gamma-aminobutyrate hydrolase PuuD
MTFHARTLLLPKLASNWLLTHTDGNLKIGLTQRVLFHKNRAYDSIDQGWYSYLVDHTLFFVPNRTDQNFEALSNSLEALIITGGDDSTLRRTVELKLARLMMQQGKPIIGICHGCFLLTDVLGGTIEECITHMDTSHAVYYFGEEQIVNSYHSLQITKPHSSATVLAVDSEGYCESWIDKNLAGVVWHPERMKNPWIPDEIENLLKETK